MAVNIVLHHIVTALRRVPDHDLPAHQNISESAFPRGVAGLPAACPGLHLHLKHQARMNRRLRHQVHTVLRVRRGRIKRPKISLFELQISRRRQRCRVRQCGSRRIGRRSLPDRAAQRRPAECSDTHTQTSANKRHETSHRRAVIPCAWPLPAQPSRSSSQEPILPPAYGSTRPSLPASKSPSPYRSSSRPPHSCRCPRPYRAPQLSRLPAYESPQPSPPASPVSLPVSPSHAPRVAATSPQAQNLPAILPLAALHQSVSRAHSHSSPRSLPLRSASASAALHAA